MKKFIIAAVLLLMSTLSFAGTISYYNQTDQVLQFFRDGVPPGPGSQVIPNGYYSETVSYGDYHLSATNGTQVTSGYDCTISADNDRCDYRVFLKNTSSTITPGLKLIADLDYHNGFTVDAPVTLKTDGPQAGTTNNGVAYTETLYSGTLANEDTYMVGVSVYPFAVTNEDLARATEGFRGGVKGTVTKTETVTISGQPAEAAIITAEVNGRTIRFALITTFKGNKAYFFCFGTWLDTKDTNMDEVKTFFTSARLN